MIAISHPTGNSFVRTLLARLVETKRLARFFTTLSVRSDDLPGWLPAGLRGQLSRRDFDVPKELIEVQPWREAVRLLAAQIHLDGLTTHEKGWASMDRVYKALDHRVARWLERDAGRRARIVYAYEDGACESFKLARELGLHRAYELPIAYWETARALLEREAVRLPEWAPTLGSTQDSDEKLGRKTEELALADTIICPSDFVVRSLPGGVAARKKVVLAPFGSPPPRTPGRLPGRQRKLRVLFAGSMTQRKGLADLFQAMKLLQRADLELVVMGSLLAPMAFYRQQYSQFTYEAPRPREGVLSLMETCDVLALPSIVEGRALVQQEGMSRGLGLIATANAGGEDLIEEGKTGYLVKTGAPEEIAAKLDLLASDRKLVEAMSHAARAKAATYTWASYADKIEAGLPP